MADPGSDIRRLLVALSGDADEWAHLDAAIDLADRLQAELTTLFIEDANLLRAGMLPCVREIGRSSAQSRQLESAAIERSLKTAAAMAESRLRQMADARALRYSFQVMSGQPLAQLLKLAQELDAMLLSPPIWERRRPPSSRPIVVIYDDSAGAGRALAMASGLARGTASPVHVLIPAEDETSYRQRLNQARQHTAGLIVSGERVMQAMPLSEQINRLGASLLVLHAGGDFDAAALDRLRNRLCCDLLALR